MIPNTRHSFQLSRPALVIVGASIILAALLTTIAYRNVNRSKDLMEGFLFKQGQTLIRAFEAGARSSMMMHARGNLNLKTLVQETVKSDAVSYITITDEQGNILSSAGNWRPSESRPPIAAVLQNNQPMTSFLLDSEGRRAYEIAREFSPVTISPPGAKAAQMQEHWRKWCDIRDDKCSDRLVIFVGLPTDEFDAAQQKDFRHNLIMVGILFLIGSAGFYFIFLYQAIRVSNSTLENMELYTKNVIESMPAGLITLDAEGKIVAGNRKTTHFFGKPLAELQGKTLRQISVDHPLSLEPLVRTGEDFLEQPMDFPQPDGTNLPVKVSASGLLDRENRKIGTVLIFRDMMEIRAMEEQLERSRRLAALGRMAVGIAHEIRNPLSTLRGMAQYFAGRAKDNPADQEYADLMISEIDRLNRTISSLLQFAKPREPLFELIDITALLKKSARLLAEDANSQQIKIELDLSDEPVTLEADADLLLQVLINLIKNSLEAMAADGLIKLKTLRDRDEVRIVVQDNGTGMTPENIAHMFDPFYTTRKSGTGLGLAVVHQIVEQHDGRLEVKSSPGSGTTVEVILPRSRRQIR